MSLDYPTIPRQEKCLLTNVHCRHRGEEEEEHK